jgi:beta-glucosidase
MTLSSNSMTAGSTIKASVTVTNTGSREGAEVVQFYIRDMVGSIARPVQELKGFERINLKPGESRTVTFTIDQELLKFYNKDLDYVCEPGDFEAMIGPNSRDVQRKAFSLSR